MKIMNCPLNGPRNISEFVYGGQVKTMPDHTLSSDSAWAEYVFYEKTEHDKKQLPSGTNVICAP